VDGLALGTYALSYLSGNKKKNIHIEVVRGSLWEPNDSFILKQHCLIERMKSAKIARISKLQITNKQATEAN
jgi:hypothetical protein